MPPPPRAVLALCLGNICRSPIAEGLLRHHAAARGLALTVDSAGTSGHHEGEPPDPRSAEVMRRHGHDISAQRARPLRAEDLERFDLILAMDARNLRDARLLAPTAEARGRVRLLLDEGAEVPDPYYGGEEGFERVYALIDAAAAEWARRWAAGEG